jgi:hypothetical protein
VAARNEAAFNHPEMAQELRSRLRLMRVRAHARGVALAIRIG